MANTSNDTRILYVDPNDVYGVKDSEGNLIQEQMIPYEDLCISFNLTVQNFSRFKQNSGTVIADNNQEFTISWDSTPTNAYSASYLNGSTFGVTNEDGTQAPRYLTTYYTDISFENYGTKKIIEGLGVSSVEVSWESWYTPTVVIKFVDVRGSALWGNEEAIHENGRVTVDNIFGAFFTTPYPIFKLQMKGFLGKAVTFQLTLTDFRGEYNSAVGDFQATATFIGYSYGLLTDIPLEYIIAAPYCEYEGKKYWESKCNSAEWQLYVNSDGTPVPPRRLFDFFEDVKSATPEKVDGTEEANILEDESNELTNIANKKTSLRNLKSCFTDFTRQLKQNFDNCFMDSRDKENDGKRQIFLMSNGKNDTIDVQINNDTKNAYEKVLKTLKEHNEVFADCLISANKLPNKWLDKCPDKITLKKTFIINESGSTASLYHSSGQTPTLNRIQSLLFNDNRKLHEYLAREIRNVLINRYENKNILREYGYIVDIDGFESTINSTVYKLQAREKEIKDNVAKRTAEKIETLVHFKPFIGNFFKILMCHLETFIHIMYSAYKEIEEQRKTNLRTPANLGILLEETDIPTDSADYVVPWPKVVNNGASTSEGGQTDTSRHSVAWVGDFSHNFVEEKVVLAIEAAIRQINTTIERSAEGNKIEQKTGTPLPLVPTDFGADVSAFQNVVNNLTLSSLAGYLGIRAFQVLGVLCNSSNRVLYAQTLGKMDAYNFYYCTNKDTIKEKILDKLPKGDKGQTLVKIATCDKECDNIGNTEDGSSKSFQDFERYQSAYSNSGRDPIMVANGNDYVFAHFYNQNKVSLIPSKFYEWNKYRDWFQYQSVSDFPYYDIKEEALEGSGEWVSCVDSSYLLKQEQYQTYINKSMFRIICDNDEAVNAVLNTYDTIKSNIIQVNDISIEDNFDSYLNKFWSVEDKDFYGWFDVTNLSKKRSELGFNENKLFPLDGSKSTSVDFSATETNKWVSVNEKNIVTAGEMGFKVNDTSTFIDNLTIEQFECWENASVRGSIFGSPFYYMQNRITDEKTKAKVKALLFLHSLKYNTNKILGFAKTNKTNGRIEAVPYGYLLLCGGLLWRKRQTTDPIIWEYGTKKYKKAGLNCTLFTFSNNLEYIFATINSDNNRRDYYLISLMLGIDNIDYNIQNQLITLFEDFATNTFTYINKVYELKPSAGSEFNEATISNLINSMYYNSSPKTISQEQSNNLYTTFSNTVVSWKGIYRMVVSNNKTILALLNEESVEMLDIIKKDIYVGKAIVLDGCWRKLEESGSANGNYSEVKIGQNVYTDYVSTFINTLESIVNGDMNSQVEDDSSPAGSEKLEKNRDICINIYTYCKNLWDKWLTPKKDDDILSKQYNVEPFFTDNFIFIDSYYCNTYDRLALNCSILYEVQEALSEKGMLINYIGQILSRHHCMFFSVPDFVGVANDTKSRQDGQKNLVEMFKAVPYNEMVKTAKIGEGDSGKPDNKFVMIYVEPSSSMIGASDDYFTSDSFDIWSRASGSSVAPDIFKVTNLNESENNNYLVPSFGVAMNRQNNHIFKSLKVSMNNPVMTEQAAQALENAYRKGGEGERRVVFHGQDIYNIYSNYSYLCDIEMLGNAQIWPLMYFQLLNVPMWRGTYIIYKVKHSMAPGIMSTVFSGMRLTKTPSNMAQYFFTIKGERSSTEDTTDDSGSGYGSGTYPDMPSEYRKIGNPLDYFHMEENWSKADVAYSVGSKGVSDAIISLYNRLHAEIKVYLGRTEQEKDKNGDWNVMLTSVKREGSIDGSDHNSGYAMDLMSMTFNGSDWVKDTSDEQRKRLFTALDIVFCNHREEIRQVILEYYNVNDMHDGSWYSVNKLCCLHVAAYNPNKASNPQTFFIASKDINCAHINKNKVNNDNNTWFLQNVTPEFRFTAARCWKKDNGNFKKMFTNYQYWGKDTLERHFSESAYIAGTASGTIEENIPIVMNTLRQQFSYYSSLAICANMMRESGLNPTAVGDSGKAIGICQWHPDRQVVILSYCNKGKSTNYNYVKDMTLEEQVYSAIEEMKTEASAKSKLNGNSVYNYLTQRMYNQEEDYKKCTNIIDMMEYVAYRFMDSFERPAAEGYTKFRETNKANIYKIIDYMNYQGLNTDF